MSTITLPNIRVSSDLTVSVRLKDNGVSIDWSTLNNVKASIYSDAQRALAGRCDVSVDAEDPTVLVCQYAANKPQYVGVCRIVVSAKYMGETKTYDKPAFNFVRWTADQDGEQITIDDPDVDVEIEVSDVSSSLLDEAIRAAFTAAEEAVDAKGQVLETEAEVEAAEALRVSAEESRVEAEEGRAEAEAARVDEEAVRVSAEDARVVAENARAAAEDLREGAEDDRAAAETARETAEAARVAAEALRVTAEGSRETAEAAREAQASADHTVAAGDHTQAAADHTQAAADHTTAASDHTQAGADHTLAAADHVTAGEDHAQAQDDHEVVAGYDTRLGNVEGEVSQLEAKVDDNAECPDAKIHLDLIGQNAVTNSFSLVAGRHYRMWFIADWPANQTSGANKFALRYSTSLEGAYTDQFYVAISAAVPEYYDFIAQTNFYDIWARGNNGEAVNIVIEDTTSLQEIRDDLFFVVMGKKNSTQTAINTLNVHNYSEQTVTSDYIEVSNPFTLNADGEIASGHHIGMRVLFFDEYKNVLASRGDYGTYAPPKTYDIANTKYIKISVRYYDSSNTLINITPEDVEPFKINVLSNSKIDISIGELNDKRFYIPAIANLKFARRNAAGTTLTPPPLTLLQFTDLHGDIFHLSRVADWAREYHPYIDDVIHLGDAVYNTYADDFSFWAASKYAKFLNVIGNHDAASGGGFTSSLNTYNKFFAPYITNWGVTQPENAALNGYCYYYKDYTTQGIRLIVCDSMHWDATQNTWLQSTLASAKTSGLSVIVAQHYPLSTAQCSFIDCGFTSFKTGLGVATGMPNEIISAVDSFIGAGGKFICHINGHTHIDIISYTSGSTYKQLSITTDTATDRLPQWQDGDRTLCAKSTDAFNLVGFDSVSKTIRIVKVGKNTNQAMQKALAICISYDETGVNPPTVLCEV